MVLPNDVFFDLLERGSDPVLFEALGIHPLEAFDNGADDMLNVPASSDGRFTELDDVPQYPDSTAVFGVPLEEIRPNDSVPLPMRCGEPEHSSSKKGTARKPRA